MNACFKGDRITPLALLMKNARSHDHGFTLLELLVVIAVAATLAASLLSALAGTRPQSQRMTCANNLKQVGLAFHAWAVASNGNTPMTLPGSQGGGAENVGSRLVTSTQSYSRGVSKLFLCMSNELATPAILFCPAEFETSYRQAATSFSPTAAPRTVPYTNDLNVSYFIGVDGSETSPRMLLTGDHNLGGNLNPPTVPYLAAVSTGTPFVSLGTNFNANQGPAFMDNMHARQGNVGMADGTVEWFNRSHLQDALKSSGDRGRNAGSFALATGSNAGSGCNRIQLP